MVNLASTTVKPRPQQFRWRMLESNARRPSMADENTGLMSRIGNWFKRGPRPSNGDMLDPDNAHGDTSLATSDVRAQVVRRMSKRDQAVAMQEGFNALTNLMTAIKDNLNDQGRRQDELLKCLAHLPQALQAIPESNRIQGETLRTIHARLEQ